MDRNNFLNTLISFLYSGTIGMFGGIAHYLYKVNNGEKFQIKGLLLNMILSFFIGYVVATFLPDIGQIKYGIVSLSGYCSYPILAWLQDKGYKYIIGIIKGGIRKGGILPDNQNKNEGEKQDGSAV